MNRKVSSIQAWILAFRPKTLPAALAPVVVGTAVAIADDSFVVLPAAAALLVALFLQIGVNLANDYFDGVKGVDTQDRLGPVRVTASGLIAPSRVKAAMVAALCLAALDGLYLVYVGGWPIFVLGVCCLASVLLYSGGPYPLASLGIADLFVFFFFGPVAVAGTYYVQAGHINNAALAASFPVGFLITAIFVVNNLRDVDTDKKAGKMTSAVLLGKTGAKAEFSALVGGAYFFAIVLWAMGSMSVIGFLIVFAIPLAFSVLKSVWTQDGEVLNQTLAKTALLSLIFSLLLSLGLVFA